MNTPTYAPTLLIKPASAECNLDCSYCFYHRPEDPYQQASRRRMTPDTLEALVRNQFAATSRPLSFMFQGGDDARITFALIQQLLGEIDGVFPRTNGDPAPIEKLEKLIELLRGGTGQ